jgi:hypothetical protein
MKKIYDESVIVEIGPRTYTCWIMPARLVPKGAITLNYFDFSKKCEKSIFEILNAKSQVEISLVSTLAKKIVKMVEQNTRGEDKREGVAYEEEFLYLDNSSDRRSKETKRRKYDLDQISASSF